MNTNKPSNWIIITVKILTNEPGPKHRPQVCGQVLCTALILSLIFTPKVNILSEHTTALASTCSVHHLFWSSLYNALKLNSYSNAKHFFSLLSRMCIFFSFTSKRNCVWTNKTAHARKRWKNALRSNMNSALHVGYSFVSGKVGIWNCFLQIQSATSTTVEQMWLTPTKPGTKVICDIFIF